MIAMFKTKTSPQNAETNSAATDSVAVICCILLYYVILCWVMSFLQRSVSLQGLCVYNAEIRARSTFMFAELPEMQQKYNKNAHQNEKCNKYNKIQQTCTPRPL